MVTGRKTISPDGRWLAATRQGGLNKGSQLYVGSGNRPTRVIAVDVSSGSRTVLHELGPRDSVGAGPVDLRLTPDGRSYAYGYLWTLQSLYQISGVR